MAIITYPLNGTDYDATNAETYLCTRISGVYASEGHYEISVTGDREITVGTGLAWIRNTDHSGKSIYNESPVSLNVPVADGALPRIDRVVIRFTKASNMSEVALKQGTPASNPVPPELSKTELVYELGIANINIAASSVVISEGDIESTILDEDACGLMRDGVTGIPTQQLYDTFMAWYTDIQHDAEVAHDNFVEYVQETAEAFARDSESAYQNFFETLQNYEGTYTEEFLQWFESIKDLLSGDVAGNIAEAIEEMREEIEQLKADIVIGTVMSAMLTEDGLNITTEDGEDILAIRTFH